MDFRLLGPFEVVGGTAPVPVAAGKQRALLAILLLNANRTVPRDRIVDELWGDDVPESAQKMVQIHVSHLRKALPEPRLHTRPPGYLLEVADEELDLGRFEQLVAAGRKALAGGDAGTAAELLRQALGLWRGPALAEFSEPFARHESARLEELRAAALEWRIEADLALGDHGDVVGELEALIARYPLRERLRSQHMLALYRSGRHAEALDAYQAFRRMLDDELGIAPPAGLKDLERRMLRQDPSLDAPRRPPAARAAPVEAAAAPPAPGVGAERAGEWSGSRQEVRFCIAPDGPRIAYAVHGRGSPLVRTATWLTHLELDWESPVWRHWLTGLAERHTVLRYDERGCGLSDRDVDDLSLDARVADLEAVIDAADVDRFALLGMSQGGPVAIEYAARHPDRVSHLILYATYARGRLRRDPSPSAREQAELMVSLIRMGWGQDQPAFRRLFTTLFIPDAAPAQMEWFDELQRATTDAETAVRIRTARNHDEVTGAAARVKSPTLVLHPRHDALVPFSEGRLLATLIPRARLVPLESRNHILLADEPAWTEFLAELHAFLAPTEKAVLDAVPELSKP